MITIEQLWTWFIAWKPGTDLGIRFSDNESETGQTDIPIHKPLDTRNVHTSMDTLPNMVHRRQNKGWDTCSVYSAGGRVAYTRYCILHPWGDMAARKDVGNTKHARKGAECGLRVGSDPTESC